MLSSILGVALRHASFMHSKLSACFIRFFLFAGALAELL
jgi:hypothetical protein